MIFTHKHTHTLTHTQTHTHMYTHTHTYKHTHTHTHTHTETHTHTFAAHICSFGLFNAHNYVCTYIVHCYTVSHALTIVGTKR